MRRQYLLGDGVSSGAQGARRLPPPPFRPAHLQAREALLPVRDLERLLLAADVAVQQVAEHDDGRGVDAEVLSRLLEVGRALAACGQMREAAWQ